MRFYLFHFIFSFFVYNSFAEASDQLNVVKELQGVPKKDKEGLSDFFEELIIQDAFGYTVFGDKPISFTAYLAPGLSGVMHFPFPTLINGLELWNKYSTLFPSKNFVFKQEYSPADCWGQVYLINRKATLKAIENNLDVFQQILGPAITPQALLAEIEREDSTIRAVLQRHEGLFGILLGFGRENSFAFQKRNEIGDVIQTRLMHPLMLSEEQAAIIQKNYRWFLGSNCKKIWSEELLEAPLDDLIENFLTNRKEFCGFNKDYDFLLAVRLPDFVAIQNTPETNELLEKYTKIQCKLAHIYAKGNILEEVLCAMVTE